MRQVLFDYTSWTSLPVVNTDDLVPRHYWFHETFKDAFGMLGCFEPHDPDNAEHYNLVIQQAQTRQGIYCS